MTMKLHFPRGMPKLKLKSIFRSKHAKDKNSKNNKKMDSSFSAYPYAADKTEELESFSEDSCVSVNLDVSCLSLNTCTTAASNSTSSVSSVTNTNPPQAEAQVQPDVTATTHKPLKKQKKVSFSDVSVRQYELILGDNPGLKYPLSLGWNYTEDSTVKVDTYEDHRQERHAQEAQDRIEPRLYTAPADEDKILHKKPAVDHYMPDVHFEQDYEDYKPHVPFELSLYERRAKLRGYGYTEATLCQMERQRLTALALDWSTQSQDEGITPFPFSQKYITRCVM